MVSSIEVEACNLMELRATSASFVNKIQNNALLAGTKVSSLLVGRSV